MERSVKMIVLAPVFVVLALIVYFGVVIIKAKIETPGIAAKALRAPNITLKYSDLSPWQLHALLAVEDPNFYHHKGIDLKTPGAGITTISQSLVKIYYFKHFKPGLAKFKQTFIARYAFDRMVSKDDQLTLFINNINLGKVHGKNVKGFTEAARAYYHKPFRELSRDEYLSIIAMIIAPRNFNILTRPAANAERTRRIRRVVSGAYKPKSLMDIYYGKLDPETSRGLPPASYFPSLYH